MTIKLDESRREALDAVIPAVAAFKRAFGRDISADSSPNSTQRAS